VIDQKFREQNLKESDTEPGCFSFKIPTAALLPPELAISYHLSKPKPFQTGDNALTVNVAYRQQDSQRRPEPVPSPSPLPNSRTLEKESTIESLLTFQFRPFFEKGIVIPQKGTTPPFAVVGWHLEIPAGRLEYNDSIDHPDVMKKFGAQWSFNGTTARVARPPGADGSSPAPAPSGWDDASRRGQIHLILDIKKPDLQSLPEHQPIYLLRGSDRIGRLPDLWSALLPTKLTAKYISATQFSLEGTNAGAIDAVSLQGPGAPNTVLPATGGADFVLVTLPAASKSAGGAGGDSKPTIGKPSPAKGAVGATIIVPGSNLGAKGKVTFTQGKNLAKDANIADWDDINLAVTVPDGLTAGAAKINVYGADGTPIGGAQTFTVTTGKPGAKPPFKEPPAPPLSAGTYTVLPLVDLGDGNYLPLDVTDKDGNALTFAVPAQPAKTDTTSNDSSGKTTTITITKKTTGGQTPAATPPAANAKKPQAAAQN